MMVALNQKVIKGMIDEYEHQILILEACIRQLKHQTFMNEIKALIKEKEQKTEKKR